MAPTTLGQRILLAHLDVARREGRRIPQGEFGRMVADAMGRPEPFSNAVVSEWQSDKKVPPVDVLAAIARVAGWDPGYLAFGDDSGAPTPDEDTGKGRRARGK